MGVQEEEEKGKAKQRGTGREEETRNSWSSLGSKVLSLPWGTLGGDGRRRGRGNGGKSGEESFGGGRGWRMRAYRGGFGWKREGDGVKEEGRKKGP